VALVERGGKVRTRIVAAVNAANLKGAIRDNVDASARIMTDENNCYHGIGQEFEGGHHKVHHARKEYARGDICTNTVEGFFALLKRGIYGTFHNVSKKHLHRYLAEFEFRYNTRDMNDGDRIITMIRATEGKRLLYREPLVV
jgi:transposase-like protein